MNYKISLLIISLQSLALGVPATSQAQTSTSVENLTSVSSTVVKGGLGFNMTNENNEWEFQMAAAAGATEARFQPGWSSVQNMSGAFSMPTADANALDWCSTYGINPLLVAAYGPPYQSIGTFTVAQAYPIGTTSIKLNQSVASVTFPYCHVMESGGTQIVNTGQWGYYGALIASVNTTNNTITLAAPTSIALSSGQSLVINQLLYPSCATASPTDPSIVAYGSYVSFLGSQIAAHSLTGRVEIWNEPPWAHDPWDHRGAFYTTAPQGITTVSPNFGIAENLAPTVAATGVHYNWAGTNKSGTRSVLNTGYMSPPLTAAEVASSIACEGWHPYGNCPEDDNWNPTILASGGAAYTAILVGGNESSNFVSGRQLNLNNPSLNFKQNITETGLSTSNNVQKARFNIRQYLAYLADGLERVTFYCFAAPGAGTSSTYGFVDETTEAATQAYTAIQGLVVDDMGYIPVAPVSYTASNLPTVPSYSGTYPLTTMSIVGRRNSSDTENIVYFVAWQRSHVPPGPVTNLAVTSTTAHVALSWSPNSYAVTSAVERATTNGGPYTTLVNNLNFTQGSYTDSSVTYGTTYYYIVVGTDPAGMSSNSNEVSATPVASGSGTFNNNVLPAGAAQVSWQTVSSPPAANVTAQLPTGYTAIDAWDLVTRAAVPVTLTATTATYPVSDDPICLEVVPAAFYVNFNADTVGSAPTTATFSSSAVNLDPTKAYVNSGTGSLTVVSSLGGITQPLQFMKEGLTGDPVSPSLQFVAPSSTPIATTSGTVALEWDECITSLSGETHTTETLLTNRIIATGTTGLSLNFVTTGSSGGFINFSPGNGENTEPTWTFNTPIHFKLVVNITAGTYSAWADGVQFATNRALVLTNVLGMVIEDGTAEGGYDGTWYAAINNVWISTGLY